ncbi:MAG: hypothetical protein HOJ35_01970 [Bdellovibrionales bacterium]|nr:hypothetical protein [Bdellovibrionales bacterium]
MNQQMATCMPDNCFCEKLHHDQCILQPSNAWSNISFLLVTLLILIKIKDKKKQNHFVKNNYLIITYGITCAIVGLGSFYYHSTLTFISQWVDVLGMYLAVTFFILYNFFSDKKNKFISSYILVNLFLGYLLYAVPDLRRYLFAASIIILFLVIFIKEKKRSSYINYSYLKMSILSFLTGYIIWLLDYFKILCWPESIVQGHALWHCFSAISSLLIFHFYFSEDSKDLME